MWRRIFKADARPRLHPLDRSPHVDRVCSLLEKAWRVGIANRPSLEPDALWTKASRGLSVDGEHFGRSPAEVADFRLRLEKLSEALLSEARLNALGLTLAHGQMVRAIRQRLCLGLYWQQHPQVLTTDFAPPIFIIGHMRGGTTRLHRLLAADPAFAFTRFCNSWNPVPERPDRRRLRTAFALAAARAVDPWLDSIHPFGASRADEELGWLAAALHPAAYEAQWHIPSFSAFSEARNSMPVYREFLRLLRTDAFMRGNAPRPRVMKVPCFAEDLATLLKLFPDAKLVVANQMTIQSDSVELDWIEAEWRRKIALREMRMAEALAGFRGPIAEVDYAAIEQNWESAIARAYRNLDLPLSDAALSAMRREQGRAANAAHRLHGQSYREFSRA
jgi:hypothetical protein